MITWKSHFHKKLSTRSRAKSLIEKCVTGWSCKSSYVVWDVKYWTTLWSVDRSLFYITCACLRCFCVRISFQSFHYPINWYLIPINVSFLENVSNYVISFVWNHPSYFIKIISLPWILLLLHLLYRKFLKWILSFLVLRVPNLSVICVIF